MTALKRVKVLGNYRVIHDSVAYVHGAIAEVPAEVAQEWLLNQWWNPLNK